MCWIYIHCIHVLCIRATKPKNFWCVFQLNQSESAARSSWQSRSFRPSSTLMTSSFSAGCSRETRRGRVSAGVWLRAAGHHETPGLQLGGPLSPHFCPLLSEERRWTRWAAAARNAWNRSFHIFHSWKWFLKCCMLKYFSPQVYCVSLKVGFIKSLLFLCTQNTYIWVFTH